MFYCVFVTVPCGVLGQVWSLIVSIPSFLLYKNWVYSIAFGCLNGVARIDFLTKAHRLTPFGDQNTQISLNVISNYNNGDFSH